MKQAPRFDSLPFDPFSLFQNGLAASEVGIGRGEVLQALMVAIVDVVVDERIDLLSEITGRIVIFQQDSVLKGLMPAIDLALGLRVIRGTTDMVHLLILEPICQFASYVTGPFVAERARLVPDGRLFIA